MATIDPNIALGFKPIQIENPMNRYAALSQIQNNEQANQLNAMKMQEMQRAFNEEEGVRNYLAKTDLNTPEGRAGLNQFGKTGLGISKILTDQQQSVATLKKTNVETTGLEYKQKIEKMNKALADIAALNSPQDALAGIKRHLASGDIDQAKADQLVQSIQQAPNFSTWRKTTLFNILDAKDRFQAEYQDRVATTGEKNANTSAGQLIVAQRNANIAEYNATKPVFSEAAGGFVTAPTAKNPTSVIIPLANPEATTKGKVVTQGKTDVSNLATLMGNSYQKLNDLKGITSTSRSGKSNLAASAQSSMAGQLIGGALGTEEQAERDFIKSQRPLLVQAIVKSTGITAGQINSNNELKNLLDAATDPNRGYETNIRTLNELNKRYGLGGNIIDLPTTPSKTKSNAPVQIKSDKDYNALPSGTEFVDPDGNTRRKP